MLDNATLWPELELRPLKGRRPRLRKVYPGRAHASRTQRIVDAYRAAVREGYADEGRMWWYRARTWCEERAADYGIPVEKVAGIVAVLSPSCRWERNTVEALQVLDENRDAPFTTYKRNVKKAFDILYDVKPVGALVKGPKVRAFWQLILAPHRRDVVCIDRHAARVAAGKRVEKFGRKRYRDFAADYFAAARVVRMPAPELQAVTWEWARKEIVG